MLISTKGRYTLYVMVDLAKHAGNGYVPLKEIAERQNISKKYMENILKNLVAHGLLDGVKGKGGGYRLTRPADAYPLGEILRLAEGELAAVSCTSAEHMDCEKRASCPTHPVWQKLDTLIGDYLDSVTLADLVT